MSDAISATTTSLIDRWRSQLVATAVSPAGRGDISRFITWMHRWGFASGLAVIFILAVVMRLQLILHTTGKFFGLGNYDDGVHFAAAIGMVNGLIPYRDFLLLHPPGVVIALAPFAALSWLIGEPSAMATARFSWMLLGGLNAVLCGLVLRSIGRIAGLVGALFYALFLGAVYVEYTALLEPPATTALLLALVITRLIGGASGIGSRHYVIAGIVLGFSPVLKIWGVIAVLVVVVGIAFRRGRRAGLLTLGAAAASCAALCLPFFLAAPVEMWRMVVVAQLGRRPTVVEAAERANDVLGTRLWAGGQPVWAPMTVVLLIFVALCLVVCLIRAELRVIGALLLAHCAIVMSTPMWYLHYAGLTAAPIALAVGGATGAVLAWTGSTRSGFWVRWLLGPAIVLGLLVHAAPLWRWNVGNYSFPGPALAAGIANQPGCVATDNPMALIQMNLLQRNLDRGCQLVVDLGGYSYYQVDSPFSDVSRRKNEDFQAMALGYYRSGDAVITVRFSTRSGYTKATANTIAGWPVITEARGHSRTYSVRHPLPTE